MKIEYISTRGTENTPARSFEDVLLTGLAPDGGLYLPAQWPFLTSADLQSLSGQSYSLIATQVMSLFTGEAFSRDRLSSLSKDVYDRAFSHPAVSPLQQIGPCEWIMDLFHGPTLAFKDYALLMLGRLFDSVLEDRGERLTIVGATSGDTGSAAIEACRSCRNIDIFILHPKDRTSEVQRRQMTTVEAPNVFNIALEGTFDDCQAFVKQAFADVPFRETMHLSAVNSINWARIMAQIVYYVVAATSLGAPFLPVSFAVPTGNFGNVFAAYAARKMGVPISSLVIGSNRNDILTRFFQTGEMRVEGVIPSLSPSMDIQISSNFERYLFDLVGRKGTHVSEIMEIFSKKGLYTLGAEWMETARQDFSAYRCDDRQTLETISSLYTQSGVLIDPHTAVGIHAAREHRKRQSDRERYEPLVCLACAHPAKFPDAVERATGIRPPLPPPLEDLYERREFFSVLPNDYAKIKEFVMSHGRMGRSEY